MNQIINFLLAITLLVVALNSEAASSLFLTIDQDLPEHTKQSVVVDLDGDGTSETYWLSTVNLEVFTEEQWRATDDESFIRMSSGGQLWISSNGSNISNLGTETHYDSIELVGVCQNPNAILFHGYAGNGVADVLRLQYQNLDRRYVLEYIWESEGADCEVLTNIKAPKSLVLSGAKDE